MKAWILLRIGCFVLKFYFLHCLSLTPESCAVFPAILWKCVLNPQSLLKGSQNALVPKCVIQETSGGSCWWEWWECAHEHQSTKYGHVFVSKARPFTLCFWSVWPASLVARRPFLQTCHAPVNSICPMRKWSLGWIRMRQLSLASVF